MPIDSSPSSFYYHDEIRAAQCQLEQGFEISLRARRLIFKLGYEYYVLFIDFWWKEAVFGGRQWVLDTETVANMTDHCGHLPSIGGKTAQVIIKYMRSAVNRPESCHNWMCFNDGFMEESIFIWARHGPNEPVLGEYDFLEASGKRLRCNTTNRRITKRQNMVKTFERGKSLLDKIVTVPDLERIPGLVPIIVDNQCHLRGNMKLGHLLDNLVNLYSCTTGMLRSSNNAITASHGPDRYIDSRRIEDRRDGYREIRDRVEYSPRNSAENRMVPHNYPSRPSPRYEDRYRRIGDQPPFSSYDRDDRCFYRDERYRQQGRRDHVYESDQSYGEMHYRGSSSRDNPYRDNENGCYRTQGTPQYSNDVRSRRDVQGTANYIDHGRDYHRTVYPAANIQVKVHSDGGRTPGRNTPSNHRERTLNHYPAEASRDRDNVPAQKGSTPRHNGANTRPYGPRDPYQKPSDSRCYQGMDPRLCTVKTRKPPTELMLVSGIVNFGMCGLHRLSTTQYHSNRVPVEMSHGICGHLCVKRKTPWIPERNYLKVREIVRIECNQLHTTLSSRARARDSFRKLGQNPINKLRQANCLSI